VEVGGEGREVDAVGVEFVVGEGLGGAGEGVGCGEEREGEEEEREGGDGEWRHWRERENGCGVDCGEISDELGGERERE
jgi:hypothetical protein